MNEIKIDTFKSEEKELDDIIALIEPNLSEPYCIFTYRYFIKNWPSLCLLARHKDELIGVIICKLDMHKSMKNRGYIAMLSIRDDYRKRGIASELVQKALDRMKADGAEEVVLETEQSNVSALKLYESKFGFFRDKFLDDLKLTGVIEMSSSEEEIVVLSSGPSSPSEVSGSEYTEDEVLPEVPMIAKRRRLNRPGVRSDGHDSDSHMAIPLPELEVSVPKYNPKNDLVKENVDLRSLLDGLKSKIAEFKRIASYNMSLHEKNISLLKNENDDLKQRLKDTSDDRLDQFAMAKETAVPQTTDNSALIDSLRTKIQLLEKENIEMKREREKIHLLEQQKKTLLLRVNHLELNLKSEMRRSRTELKLNEVKDVLNEEMVEKLNQVCAKTEEAEAEIQSKQAELSLKDMKIELLQRIINSYEMESSLTKENQKTEKQEVDLKELKKNVDTLIKEYQEQLREAHDKHSLKNNPTVNETLALLESHFTVPFEKDSRLVYNLFGYEIRETNNAVILTSKFNNIVQFVLDRMEGAGLYNLRYPKFKELLTIENQEQLHKAYQDHIEKSYELPLFFAKMQLIISGATISF